MPQERQDRSSVFLDFRITLFGLRSPNSLALFKTEPGLLLRRSAISFVVMPLPHNFASVCSWLRGQAQAVFESIPRRAAAASTADRDLPNRRAISTVETPAISHRFSDSESFRDQPSKPMTVITLSLEREVPQRLCRATVLLTGNRRCGRRR